MANTKITNPELFNLGDSTSATQLPVFTTSTRPTPTTSTVQVEYLVIGGGGAGGGWGGGGGAGGYLTNYGGSKTPLTSGLDYAIAVGEGGIKQTVTATAANSGEDSSIIGTAISITATGGGAGGTYDGATGEFHAQDGGSGGGGSSMRSASSGGLGATGQGNDGGDSPAQDPNYPGGGGGGGASSVGGDGQSASGSPAYAAGNGGDGLASSITGTSITRAGGGGGFTYGITVTNVSSGGTGGGGAGGRFVSSGNGYNTSPSNAVDGQVNTGSGGGSGSVLVSGSGSQWYGGNTASGGSGIVILRYPTNSSPVIKTTGSLVYTQSTDGSDTVIQFTEGSGNVSFASAGIAVGEMIFNSTTEKVEYWDGFQWNMIKDEKLPANYSTFAAWDVGNTISYGGTGNTLYNIVNNPTGFNFTKYGGVSYDSTNKSFNFNGATGSNGAYMNFSQNAMNIPTGFTVSMWVNFTAFPTSSYLFAYGYSPSLRSQLSSTQMRYWLTPGPSGNYTPYFNHGMTTGNWYNVTMVINNSNAISPTTVKTYISQEGDSTATLKQTVNTSHGAYQNTNQLYFGCNVQNYNGNFNGQLRVMEIYDSQLSQTDIDSIVVSGSQP
jgi:hypothetical protein